MREWFDIVLLILVYVFSIATFILWEDLRFERRLKKQWMDAAMYLGEKYCDLHSERNEESK